MATIEATDWKRYVTVNDVCVSVVALRAALADWPQECETTMEALKRDEAGNVIGEQTVLQFDDLDAYLDAALSETRPNIFFCNSLEWARDYWDCDDDEDARCLLNQLQRDIEDAFPLAECRNHTHGYHQWNGAFFRAKYGPVGTDDEMRPEAWKRLQEIVDKSGTVPVRNWLKQ